MERVRKRDYKLLSTCVVIEIREDAGLLEKPDCCGIILSQGEGTASQP